MTCAEVMPNVDLIAIVNGYQERTPELGASRHLLVARLHSFSYSVKVHISPTKLTMMSLCYNVTTRPDHFMQLSFMCFLVE